MIDERREDGSNEQETLPSSRPVYSTTAYANKNKRDVPPPPPPARTSAARDRARKRRVSQGNSSSEWVWVIVAGALFAVILVMSIGAFVYVQSSQASVEVLPTAEVAEFLPTAVVASGSASNVVADEALVLPDGSSIELIPWDGESRFTMIVVGLDRRPGETGLSYRTDTMMLVSIDPQTNQIGVLSIPRDLYVQIPGYSQLQRINSAMVFGETFRAGYGPTLMMQTVQLNFGIRVHDFLAVDFQAFIDIVDAIGGITITSERTINDPQYPDMFYGYDPFYLPAGTHELSGYDALRYARTRHGDNDIYRAERQQQVIYAIRDKILDFGMVPSLVAQAPTLWDSWQDNVYTGLSFEQMIQLGLYVKDVPRESITMGVVNYEYLQGYTTQSGASVLIPNRSRLGGLMVEVFGSSYAQ
jgi:LCP family protein required for cell wall assembly